MTGLETGNPGHFRPPPLHVARGSMVHAAVVMECRRAPGFDEPLPDMRWRCQWSGTDVLPRSFLRYNENVRGRARRPTDSSCCKAGSLSPLRSAISDFCSWSRAMGTGRGDSVALADHGSSSIHSRSQSIAPHGRSSVLSASPHGPDTTF